MPSWVRRTLHSLFVVAAIMAGTRLGAQERDTVTARPTPQGAYYCCFDLTVANRHDSSTNIAEFRVRIVSGRGRFVDGSALAPPDWTIFQLPSSVIWSSNTAAADIHGGRSLGGFRICARDTGVMRVVWETRNVDGLLTSDTLVLACGNAR